jgi:post-segregation antitoxin (ccd killing protein)
MKLSVSVPDDLWETARARRPDLNPSHLIQEALESWQRQSPGTTSAVERPAAVEAQFIRARDRLAGQMREESDNGYRAALQLAEVTQWRVIAFLAEDRFDVKTWAKTFVKVAEKANAKADDPLVLAMVRAVGNLVPGYGVDTFTPTPIYLQGFVSAMRELWDAASASIGEVGG